MKKLKYFLAVLCAVFFCVAFAGCTTEEGCYVEDSFNVTEYDYYSSLMRLYVTADFKVNIPKTGQYKITYELYQYDYNGTILAEKSGLETITTDEKEYSVHVYESFSNARDVRKVNIKNVTVTFVGDETGYKGYAIGFGVAGAVLTVGLVAVFVCDKTGLFKRKHN